MLAKASAWAPGTCGELVEGTLDGRPFLITCPVELGTEICVTADGQRPLSLTKTITALQLAAQKWSLPLTELGFTKKSSLPAGKGMSSSTADIAAVLMAAGRFHNRSVTDNEIADIALSIEPTDGLMFKGITLFDHIDGEALEYLGEPVLLNILIIDPGGSVDTLSFNRDKQLPLLNRNKEPLIKEAVRLVKDGLKEGDPEKVGRGATLSAKANQETLPKPYLEQVYKWGLDLGAAGVNIAHSGTVMGLLLPPGSCLPAEAREFISQRMPEWKFFCTRLIGGGVK